MPHPPVPVKISLKKDGHQRRLHRFHISCPPYPAAGSATVPTLILINIDCRLVTQQHCFSIFVRPHVHRDVSFISAAHIKVDVPLESEKVYVGQSSCLHSQLKQLSWISNILVYFKWNTNQINCKKRIRELRARHTLAFIWRHKFTKFE